jgi:hypothetical protein
MFHQSQFSVNVVQIRPLDPKLGCLGCSPRDDALLLQEHEDRVRLALVPS